MHKRDAVCCQELLCFQSLMSRKENETQGKRRDGKGCVRSNGTERTACSEWRTEASAKSLRLLTTSRMLVGLLHLPSRTSKAFTGLVLSSPGGVQTSVYSLRYPPLWGRAPHAHRESGTSWDLSQQIRYSIPTVQEGRFQTRRPAHCAWRHQQPESRQPSAVPQLP